MKNSEGCRRTAVAYFEALYSICSKGLEKRRQSLVMTSVPRIEPGTSQEQSMGTNHRNHTVITHISFLHIIALLCNPFRP